MVGFTSEDYLNRINKVRERLEELGLDGLIVYGDALKDGNLRYLTGFAPFSATMIDPKAGYGPWSMMVIPKEEDPVIFAPPFIRDSAELQYIDPISEENWLKVKNYRELSPTLKELEKTEGWEKVGFTDSTLINEEVPLHINKKLKGILNSELENTNLVLEMRKIKTEKEVMLMEKAAGIADGVYEDLVNGIIESGKTERDVNREIKISALQKGACRLGSTIFSTGRTSYTITGGFGEARDRPVKKPSMLQFHITPRYKDYASDIDRGIGFGAISGKQRELLSLVEEAHKEAVNTLKPGIKGSEAIKAATSLSDKIMKDVPGTYMHGIGLQFEENGMASEWTLEERNTFVVAIAAYEENVGFCRAESVCVCTSNGARTLDQFDRGPIIE